MHLCVEPRLAALFTRLREDRKVEAREAESRLGGAREQETPECQHAGVPPLVLGEREEVLGREVEVPMATHLWVGGEEGVHHPHHPRLLLQPPGHLQAGGQVALHPQLQGGQGAQHQVAVKG